MKATGHASYSIAHSPPGFLHQEGKSSAWVQQRESRKPVSGERIKMPKRDVNWVNLNFFCNN
jgi:hypothetical protein